MQPWPRLVLLVLGLVLCAGLVQGLLGSLKFSTGRAETVFRVLFLAPVVLDAWLMRRRSCKPGPVAPWRLAVLLAPVALVLALTWYALHQRDAQGALFVIMLPFAHATASVILYLATAGRPKQP